MMKGIEDAGIMGESGEHDMHMEDLMRSEEIVEFAWEPPLWYSVCIDYSACEVERPAQYEPFVAHVVPYGPEAMRNDGMTEGQESYETQSREHGRTCTAILWCREFGRQYDIGGACSSDSDSGEVKYLVQSMAKESVVDTREERSDDKNDDPTIVQCSTEISRLLRVTN